MTEYMNSQICIVCSQPFEARDLRQDFCKNCLIHKQEVARYRGLGGRLNEATKQKILESRTLRQGTGVKFDFYDKGGKKPEGVKPWRSKT